MRRFLSRFALLGTALVLVATACRRDNGVNPDDPGPADRSMFDTGDELWLVDGDAQRSNDYRPFYRGRGGNPGGHILAVDEPQANTWYFVAPAKFRGQRGTWYGRTLTYDLFQGDTTAQVPPEKGVMMTGGAGVVAFDLPNRPGLTWTRFSVPMTAGAGWYDTLTRQPATESQMRSILNDLRDLRIRGEFRMDADSGGLDNVQFTAGTTP